MGLREKISADFTEVNGKLMQTARNTEDVNTKVRILHSSFHDVRTALDEETESRSIANEQISMRLQEHFGDLVQAKERWVGGYLELKAGLKDNLVASTGCQGQQPCQSHGSCVNSVVTGVPLQEKEQWRLCGHTGQTKHTCQVCDLFEGSMLPRQQNPQSPQGQPQQLESHSADIKNEIKKVQQQFEID